MKSLEQVDSHEMQEACTLMQRMSKAGYPFCHVNHTMLGQRTLFSIHFTGPGKEEVHASGYSFGETVKASFEEVARRYRAGSGDVPAPAQHVHGHEEHVV
jgi:hypothetical protein